MTSPLLLDPKISDIERRAIEAWEKEMKIQNSAISDLFLGQQVTTIECQKCKNKTYSFENFYTLSLPIPYNNKAIFYITIVKRSSEYITSPMVKYGIQIEKTLKIVIILF